MKTVDDRLHCPVCGEFNNCSLAQGENEVSKCWCFKLDINQIGTIQAHAGCFNNNKLYV